MYLIEFWSVDPVDYMKGGMFGLAYSRKNYSTTMVRDRAQLVRF